MSFWNQFNNRELSVLIWIGVFIMSMAFIGKDVRRSMAGVMKAILQIKILAILSVSVFYAGLLVYILCLFKFWKYDLLKDTLFWFFTVALSTLFKLTSKTEIVFFKKLVFESLKWTVIIEFVSNLYVFNFWIEIILVPIMIVAGAMEAFSKHKKEYEQVGNCMHKTLQVLSVCMFLYVIYESLIHINELLSIENLKSILLTPLLTILYLPCLYLMALLFAYDEFLTTLKIHSEKMQLSRETRKIVIATVGLNLTKLNCMISNYSAYQRRNTNDDKRYFGLISKPSKRY